MPSSTIQRGNILYGMLIGVSLTPVSVALGTTAEQSFTVPGIQVGDAIDVNFSGAQTTGIGIVNVRVISANTIGITFQNSTAGAVVPAAGTYNINVLRPEYLPLPSNAF